MLSFNIQQALPLLEHGAILQTTQHPLTTLWLKENLVHISNANLHAVLSIQDFYHTYENQNFYILQDDIESIDFKKDEDYYSWKQ